MALDPKYADLPWIAHGQPDVYEAGELPEADQRLSRTELEDEMLPKEIEKLRLSVNDAHKRFASCKVDSSKVDFSDSIAGAGKRGYTIETDEYELLPPGARERESFMSRLQRLQTEVAQLVEDAASVSDQSQANQDKPVNPAELSKLAEVLSDQLKQLETKGLGDSTAALDTADKTLFKRVLAQLDAFKSDRTDVRKPEDSTRIVYEIYDRQDVAKQTDLERVADMDRRIQRLEALIGHADPAKLSALTADTAQRSLLETASRLSARTALLHSGHLDMIETRLSSLHTKLQSITEKRETLSDADTQNKVAELYELVKKWNDVADSLPMIVERLSELKELHEEASEFSSVLSSIENGQKSVSEHLDAYSKLLTEVQLKVDENMETLKKDFSSLESRLS
ncbi:Dynactin subunit 2 [Clonorchis sinensis]|uniref:Dynactin subunit 2 n=1 Tax=Clonorchis sinensis TaxID=79923 RepID=A0A8T1MGP7_CLOSI|nr:Dynactin subunit 2 [Clonorchis sinensis]